MYLLLRPEHAGFDCVYGAPRHRPDPEIQQIIIEEQVYADPVSLGQLG
nr:hypothetical protein [Marispirochaeta sp.]